MEFRLASAQWMGWKGSTGEKIPEETGGSLSQVLLEGTAWDWEGGSDVRGVHSSYTKSDESKATGGAQEGTQLCQHLNAMISDPVAIKQIILFCFTKRVINCNRSKWKLIPMGRYVSFIKGWQQFVSLAYQCVD